MSSYSTHSGLSATLTTSLSPSLFLFIFWYFLFHPHQSRQLSTPWRPALPQVSSYRGRAMLALEGSLGFLLIVLSASRHFGCDLALYK